jgi:hypothetical protein
LLLLLLLLMMMMTGTTYQFLVKGIGNVIPVLTKHHAMKTYWGSESMAPHIL